MKGFRNALFQAHWLVGITAGCVLAVTGLTGALLAYEDQILASLNDGARMIEPQNTPPLPAPVLLARIEASHPEAQVISLTLFSDPAQATNVKFAVAGAKMPEESRYVNPYTGALSPEAGDDGEAFFRSVRGLHRWLMLGEWGDRDIGRQVVGACTLLLVLMCATGLYLRWPRNGHSFRAWLVPDFSLRGRAFLWSLHATIGTWMLLLYLVIALTGLQWSYDWYRSGLYGLAGEKQPQRRERPQHTVGHRPDITRAWNTFLQETDASGFSRATLQLPRGPGAPFEVRYLERSPAHSRAFSTLVGEPVSGTVVRHERYAEKDAGGKLVASLFALHSGQFFGMPGILAFMLASLAMPLFVVTGWMLYLGRRRRRARSRARMSVTAVTQSR